MHSPIMSPLVWDLGHIAAYEDLWLAHRHAGLELLRPDLAELYDAFETPRAMRGEIETLGPAEARNYLAAVRARVAEAIDPERLGDGIIYEMVLRHELQHSETMRQTMAIADLLPDRERARFDAPLRSLDPRGWTGDPERPLRDGRRIPRASPTTTSARVTPSRWPPSQIARQPVSNASWMRFSEGGGYERREWWSAEGWAWKQEYDITHHPPVATGRPNAPVCHVSLVRGRRLRPSARCAPAHRGRVGEGGEEGAAGHPRRSGRLGVDEQHLPRLSRLRRPPVPRVLGGVLRRGLPRAARRLVGDASPRCQPDLPQLGPAGAPADLRRCAPGASEQRDGADRQSSTRLRSDRLAPGGQPRNARSPTTCSTVSRGPSRNCRPSTSTMRAERSCSTDLRAARVLPDPRRARDPRAARRELSALTGAVELVELGSGTAAKTRVLLDALHAAGTLERYVPVDVTESMVRECAADAHRRVPGPARTRRDRRLRASPRPGAERHRVADRRLPRRHDRQLPARQPPARPARDRPPARPGGPPADGHRPRQGPGRPRGRLRRRAGRHRGVQP